MKYDHKKNTIEYLYIYVLLLIVLYQIVFFLDNGYLSSTFFYDKSDTFMDFFNVYYWAYNDDRYTEWKSIYSPFSFLLSKIYPFNEGVYIDAYEVRKYYYQSYIIIMFFLIALFIANELRQGIEKKEIIIKYFSFPILITLERGNLIIFAYFFWSQFLFHEKKSKYLSSFYLALCISIKLYFISVLILIALSFRVRLFFGSILFLIILTIISALFLKENNYMLIFENISGFSGLNKSFEWGYLGYSYINVLNLVDIDIVYYIQKAVTSLVLIIYFIALNLYFTYRRCDKSLYILTFLCILIVVPNSGGYVAILLLPFYNYFKEKNVMFFLFLICIVPFTIDIPYESKVIEYTSFLTNIDVSVDKAFHLMMMFRPAAALILFFIVFLNLLQPNKKIYE